MGNGNWGTALMLSLPGYKIKVKGLRWGEDGLFLYSSPTWILQGNNRCIFSVCFFFFRQCRSLSFATGDRKVAYIIHLLPDGIRCICPQTCLLPNEEGALGKHHSACWSSVKMLPRGTQRDTEGSQEDRGAIGLVHTNHTQFNICACLLFCWKKQVEQALMSRWRWTGIVFFSLLVLSVHICDILTSLNFHTFINWLLQGLCVEMAQCFEYKLASL